MKQIVSKSIAAVWATEAVEIKKLELNERLISFFMIELNLVTDPSVTD